MSDPWKKIPKKIQDIILYGSDDEEIKICHMMMAMKLYTTKKPFEVIQ